MHENRFRGKPIRSMQSMLRALASVDAEQAEKDAAAEEATEA